MTSPHPAYRTLLTLSLLLTFGGIATFIPWDAASKINIWGYRSLCTFTPAAGLFCFALAGLSCIVRSSYFSATAMAAGSQRRGFKAHWRSFIPVGILLILGTWAAFTFWGVDQQYRNQLQSVQNSTTTAAPASGNDTQTASMSAAPVLHDGSYTGTAGSADVRATLQLTIKNGEIRTIDLQPESHNITLMLHQRLTAQVLDSQGNRIDAVSGATLSSEVWQQALLQAWRASTSAGQ